MENPNWTSARKDMVGGTLERTRLWFTIAEGMLTEVFHPRLDLPQIKELNLIVSDGRGFWTDLRGSPDYEVEEPAPGVPALTIRHRHDRFSLISRICADPVRDVVLLDLELQGDEELGACALLTARLGNEPFRQSGWVLEAGGMVALVAEEAPYGLALMVADEDGRDGFGPVNIGIVGEGDTWRDFAENGRMSWRQRRAGPGYLCLAGALPRRCTLALGFDGSAVGASALARASLSQPFARSWNRCAGEWQRFIARIHASARVDGELRPMLARSAMVLKLAIDHTFPGGLVAAFGTPWGDSVHTSGGYHLVWPRDLVESAGALLALGLADEARHVLQYLIATQRPDGHWLQNQWITGEVYWTGIQLDEAALPVLLAGLLADRGALDGIHVADMVRRALGFIARSGPLTGEDRWEQDGGLNPFTLVAMVSALVEGAQFLDDQTRRFALELADEWNASIEQWTYKEGGALSGRLGIPGHYVRDAPDSAGGAGTGMDATVQIPHRQTAMPAGEQLSMDFLQVVRYGLRRADDPRVVATLKAVDALLKSDTPSGPVWRRYVDDAYGEQPDGSPFDGSGRGRGWPLLVGERGHYALLAGEDPLPYLQAMIRMSGKGGLLPEQVWDADPIPEKGLHPGKPTGSAMPLVWAHAEFVKLAVSRTMGEPVDRPPRVHARYRGRVPRRRWAAWSFRLKRTSIPSGLPLRLLLNAPATVRWGRNGWREVADCETQDSGLSVHWADLPVGNLAAGETVNFTFRWHVSGGWEGRDFEVTIAPG